MNEARIMAKARWKNVTAEELFLVVELLIGTEENVDVVFKHGIISIITESAEHISFKDTNNHWLQFECGQSDDLYYIIHEMLGYRIPDIVTGRHYNHRHDRFHDSLL